MLTFSALVAGSFSLGSMAAPLIAPAAFTALRFAIAAALVGAAALASGSLSRASFAAPWRHLLLGTIFASYFVLMFEGLKTAPAVSTAAVFTLTPLLSAGFGWILLRQRLTRRMAMALGIGAAGAVWVIFRADLVALMRFEVGRGEAIFFAGCIAHAAYTPLVRRLNRGETPLAFTFVMLLAGTLVLTLWARDEVLATDWPALPAVVWITLGYTAVFASAATFVLLQYATLRLPSAKVMAYTYLTPCWVILWEAGLGRGLPHGLVLAGIGLTVLALAMLLRDEEIA
ncbi:MAG: EamA family transporter [Alphaproteobacteria bacterium HGW-Alphaproteobacteria-6]|nr:MAG: EamA family transporter [Alphaproteobacteria bacterium HGW-Alphaproteobacteria-6]